MALNDPQRLICHKAKKPNHHLLARFIANILKWLQVLLYITKNLIKHRSFVSPQLNDQTVLFLTIQFDMSQKS